MDAALRGLERRAAGEPQALEPLRHARRRAGEVRYAVISDGHADAEALRAALAGIEAQAIERVVCLGDLIGFGPDPVEGVDLVLGRRDVVRRGDFEGHLDGDPAAMNGA